MNDVLTALRRWNVDVRQACDRLYRAPTPRERERWHALWLLSRGWSSAPVGAALERDAHTVALWLAAFRDSGPEGLAFEQTGGSPPPALPTSRPK